MRNIAAALIWTKNNDRVIKIKHIESHFNREFWYCGDGPRPKWHGPTGWKYLLWVLNYKWGLNSQYVHKRYDARYGIYELVVFEFEEGWKKGWTVVLSGEEGRCRWTMLQSVKRPNPCDKIWPLGNYTTTTIMHIQLSTLNPLLFFYSSFFVLFCVYIECYLGIKSIAFFLYLNYPPTFIYSYLFSTFQQWWNFVKNGGVIISIGILFIWLYSVEFNRVILF